MKGLSLALAALCLLLLALKLFTYEFYLPDDPTTGIALRSEPMLESHMPLHSSAGMHSDIVLLQDENDFIGADLYRFTVRIGWLLTPLVTVLAAGALLFRHPRQSR